MAKRDIHLTALNYFIKHQDELCKKYNGKQLLMRGRKVIGAFDTFAEAVDEGERLFGEKDFTVQECIPGEDAYSMTLPTSLWGLPA